jgi:hypothetical protein
MNVGNLGKKLGKPSRLLVSIKAVAPSKAAVKGTTYKDPVRDKDNKKPTPAPKVKYKL